MHQVFDLRWWKMLLTVKYRRHKAKNRGIAKELRSHGDPRPEWLILYELWLADVRAEIKEEREKHGGLG